MEGTKVKKKMSKRKKIILISILSGILLITLTISIIIIVVSNSHKKIEFNNETTDKTTDIVEINEETEQKILNKNPMEVDSKEAMTLALSLVSNQKQFEVTTTGNSVAKVFGIESNVVINNKRTVKDGNALITCVSAGVVSNASQRYFKNDKIYIRNSKNVSSDAKVTFSNEEELETIDKDTYMNRYGWMPYQMSGYIISSSTYLENPIMKDNKDNTYTCSFNLNPKDAAFYYQREIVTNADASELEFVSISFEVTMDENFKVLTVKTVEDYKIQMSGFMANFGKIPTTTEVIDKYSYENINFDTEYMNYFSSKINQ